MSAEVAKKLRIADGQRVLAMNANEAHSGLLSGLPAGTRMIAHLYQR